MTVPLHPQPMAMPVIDAAVLPSPRERSPSPPILSPGALPESTTPEVSMVEASEFTGVTFTPELWMQRRHWALEVLRNEAVRSVLDIGCGPGSLLQTLVIPPPTIAEPPLLKDGHAPEGRELFITRLAGVDQDPAVMASAMSTLEPPEPSTAPVRWEPMVTELWLGGIERYNSRLEGYEAIVALELIEHLEPHLLSRFGVVTLGTYQPKLLLVSTPNFDFNAKFPDHGGMHEHCEKRGFVDPTGRTERVFRHSDHKCEMTADEFRAWAEAAAADWGYSVEIAGVGISSNPSFYPARDGEQPRPIYATQTAIFRLATGVPMRSPRSVRTVDLPFMRAAGEATLPHRPAQRLVHQATALRTPAQSPATVAAAVEEAFAQVSTSILSLTELWGIGNVASICGGSKRHLVSALGGWGDCGKAVGAIEGWVVEEGKNGLVVRRA